MSSGLRIRLARRPTVGEYAKARRLTIDAFDRRTSRPAARRVGAKCDPDHGASVAFEQSSRKNVGLRALRKVGKSLGRLAQRPQVKRQKWRGQHVRLFSRDPHLLQRALALGLSAEDRDRRGAWTGGRKSNDVRIYAQAMIARTDLVRADGTEYIKVVCTRSKNADEWTAEVEARKAALRSAELTSADR